MPNPLLDTIENKFKIDITILEDISEKCVDSEGSIGDLLIKRKILTEDQLLAVYSELFNLPVNSHLSLDQLDNQFTRHVPIQYLKKHLIVPLSCCANEALKNRDSDACGQCRILINDPSYLPQVDDLVRLLGIQRYDVFLSKQSDILTAINIAYDLGRDSAQELVQNLQENEVDIIEDLAATADLLDDTNDAPIIRLVNHIISQSVKARASDIHIEPSRDGFKVRYRIDGILYDLLTPPKWIQSALSSRIKILAKLNIAEKRLPQDGRFDVRIGNQEIDVRVSTIPTTFGERVVLRLLIKSNSLFHLEELGLDEMRLESMRNLIKQPNGIILVTGPTGSGKTTTLYSILSDINTPEINIITVEDPVEYQIEGISQIQVNPKIDLTFASGLRSIVRQDPDVILIGEIRDKETADIAVQSALTGHLVFSTLHTNDSASAITRLVDIGIEPFLISSSVNAVIAQRLVRTLCPLCKQPSSIDPKILARLRIGVDEIPSARETYAPFGCDECAQTGYRGRIGIFEFLMLDDTIKGLILDAFDANEIKKAALKNDMVTLRSDAMDKVFKGLTSVEEIVRVTQA